MALVADLQRGRLYDPTVCASSAKGSLSDLGPGFSRRRMQAMSGTTEAAARFAGQPCVGLDVHQKTCTATWLDPGGTERDEILHKAAPRRGSADQGPRAG